ncbi:hypothetical protein M758_11G113900 [Ceratodon purpureus]|nr:hypothetical protein M758_11G113900 [Ceratodon purpureus]
MECKEENYPKSLTEEEYLNEAPIEPEMVQPARRAVSEQSCPSPSSKVSRDAIPNPVVAATEKENQLKIQEDEGLQIQEVNEQARFIVCLTNMLPKFIATILPCFVGTRDRTKLDTWLYKVEHYLDSLQLKTDKLKINIATTLFDGFAADWWYTRTKHVREGQEPPVLSWDQFVHVMEQTFNPSEARYTIHDKLAVLKQTGSVPSYIANFLSLVIHLQDSSESEKISRFIDGLKPTPSFYISSQKPTSMLEAVRLAEKWAYKCSEEEEFSACKRRKVMTRQSPPPKTDRLPRDASYSRMESNYHPKRPPGFKRLTEVEMSEYRKRGLCFKCGGHGHTFFQCSQRFL